MVNTMNIYNLEIQELEHYFITYGEKSYRAMQIWQGLYSQKIENFSDLTTLKWELINQLNDLYEFGRFNLLKRQTSLDDTEKFLFELPDGNTIETVLMSHNYGYSICITSQVGCNMGCDFCASGILKKKRNLTAGEMVLQILEVEKITEKKITSVVVMGIGEPFDNYDNVMKFIRIINHPKGLQIGARHITVSTCGIIPGILEYMNEGIQTNLAISLHASNDELRNKLMPINNKYNISSLINAVKEYIDKTNRRVTIEYILLDSVNDSLDNALELYNLLKGLNVYINIIPYNNVTENKYSRSKNIDKFFDFLKKKNLNVIKRKEQGVDIDAACGQLRIKSLK